MPGYEDPRYVKQVVDDLQARVKTLEGQTLPMAAHQKGPVPGYMRAVQIGDVGQASSMWMNLSGMVAGQAPYLGIADASKVVRVEEGNLAANGVSAAQFGLRINNASGSPILDSFGVIGTQVMSVLASRTSAWGGPTANTGVAGPPTGISGSGGEVDIAGGNLSFTLTRQQSVRLEFWVTSYGFNSGAIFQVAAPVYARVSGQSNPTAGGASFAITQNGTAAPTLSGSIQLLSLPAATYTLNGWWNSVNGTTDTLNVYTYAMYVYLLGS